MRFGREPKLGDRSHALNDVLATFRDTGMFEACERDSAAVTNSADEAAECQSFSGEMIR
jgi:hypothetical protein